MNISLAVILFMVSGCSFIDQSVQIRPVLEVASSNIGQGKEVALKVLDDREDPVIGNRGNGMVQGAAITLDQDVVELFQGSIQNILEQKSFKVIPYDTNAPLSVKVEIRTLKYDTSMGLWTGRNMANVSFKVLVNNNGSVYEKVYRGNSEIRTAFVASQETNQKILNLAVKESLQQLAKDDNLMEALVK